MYILCNRHSGIRPIAGILLLMVGLLGCLPSAHYYVHVPGLSQLNRGPSTDEVDHPICWEQSTFPASAQTPHAQFTSLSPIPDVASEAGAENIAHSTTDDIKPQPASQTTPSTIKQIDSKPASKKAQSPYSFDND